MEKPSTPYVSHRSDLWLIGAFLSAVIGSLDYRLVLFRSQAHMESLRLLTEAKVCFIPHNHWCFYLCGEEGVSTTVACFPFASHMESSTPLRSKAAYPHKKHHWCFYLCERKESRLLSRAFPSQAHMEAFDSYEAKRLLLSRIKKDHWCFLSVRIRATFTSVWN